jgi:uroporphyrinogen III methyltransferase/synthase
LDVQQGRVYLVGAGPGDPALATLKAVECLQQAEVVIYDYLASEKLLEFAPPEAERLYVGKKAGDHAMSQEQITALLVEKGRNSVVVRLKGGDPFIFGRGGEEALALRKAGIRFEVVPGVTSAIAVPAYAGISLTHRGLSASVAFVTGHEMPGKEESDIHWDRLATGVHRCGHPGLSHGSKKPQVHQFSIDGARQASGNPSGSHSLGYNGRTANNYRDA